MGSSTSLTSLDATLQAQPPNATIRPSTPSLGGLRVRTEQVLRQEAPRITLSGPDGGAGGGAGGPAAGARPADLEVRGTLGEGGMGRVLLAHQPSLARDVAVKTLKPEAPADAAERLLLEGRVTGSLEHPGIVPVHALGASPDGAPLLVMKRIDGVSLRDLLRDRRHPLFHLLPGGPEDPLQGILWILCQVCNALHFAHSKGVIHRDIKPDNIMVGGFGEVYLLDWGIAMEAEPEGSSPTSVRELAGTPAYVAPEMVSMMAGPIGPRTDVYLLGATLYEVLTGLPRHDGVTIEDALRSARASAPPPFPGEVPAELRALCVRSTARAQAERPESALRFRQAIDEYLQHRGAEALTASAEARLRELQRLVATPGGDRAEVKCAGIECRFGFELALRAWPESPAARAGKERCLHLLCEEAIAQRQAVEAAALLGDMAAPDGALAARVRALGEELRREREAAEEAQRLARESNEQLGARGRTLAGAAVLSLGLGYSIFTQGLRLPTHQQMVTLMIVVLALLLGSVAVLRRRLLQNAYSRRTVALLVLWTVALLANRALGWARGVPVPDVLVGDLLLAAAIPGAAVVLGYRNLLVGALLCVAGAVAALLAPAHIALSYPLAIVGSQISYLLVGLWQDRAVEVPGPGAA